MARLVAITPAAGLVPVETGTARLDEVMPAAITWVAPLKGRERAVSTALKSTVGVTFPKPGRTSSAKGATAQWFGPGQALILGPAAAPENAAVADQSDAWVVLRLEGEASRDVLARLTPLDLREIAFPKARTARTLLGHMTACLTRIEKNSYEIMVFRSMAATAIHELTRAMKHIEARARL